MSRSHKKLPISGITKSKSDKQDKRFAQRAFRRRFKSGEDVIDVREVSDVWSMSKDGKKYYHKDQDKIKRK